MLYKVCKQKGSGIKFTTDCSVMSFEYFSSNMSYRHIEQRINDSCTYRVNSEYNRDRPPNVKTCLHHNMYICISCNNVTMTNIALVYSTRQTNLPTPCNSVQVSTSHNAPILEKLYDHIMSSVYKQLSIYSNA